MAFYSPLGRSFELKTENLLTKLIQACGQLDVGRYFPGDRTIEAAHQAMEQTQFGLAPEPQERSAAIDYKSGGGGMTQTPQLTNY
jgi:hypothetical protein